MRTKQQSSQHKMSWAGMLITLAVIILFSCSHKALAQQWSTSANGNDISNANSGNVGVGTTSPGFGLTVVKTNSAGGNGWTALFQEDGKNGVLIGSRGSGNAIGTITGVLADHSWIANLSLNPFGGNVGIGTTTPLYKLDVNGEINATGFRINGTPISTGGPVTWAQVDKSVSSLADITTRNAGDLNSGTIPIGRIGISGNAGVSTFLRGDNTWGPVPNSQWTSGTNNISYSSGNVGIGTTSPSAVLEASKSQAATTAIQVTNGNTSAGNAAMMRMFTSGNNALNLAAVGNAGTGGYAQISQEANLPLLFMTNNTERIRIDASGNVGIGTTTPGAKLEVVGNVNVTGTGNITAAGTIEGGNIKAKYQDVAEWVESSQELPTGTLVVLDHTRSNQVIASSQAYDTRVAGVISERPGIALGEGGDNKVLVATTGRVRLRVDTSNGPIQIGDLLVTSDIPGVAMKSEAVEFAGRKMHMPGTIIGKALEPLEKGSGTILVLLSLQ